MEARKVEAANGWEWIKQGYALFKKSPVLWIVLVMIGTAGLIAIASIPVVGDPLATLLFPVILGGLMLGCQALERGEELELMHLFAFFRHNSQPLVTLGGINLVSQLLILGIMGLTGGAALVSIMMSGQPENDPAVLMEAVTGAGLALLIGAVLFCVLLLAMQFAPMLVLFNKMHPIPALKASLRACLRNVGALSIYGIAIILFGLVASMPMMLGWLILLPVMLTSMYAGYRDLFPMQEEAAPAVEGEVIPRDDQAHF
ncbi:MAG: hypothetical protein HY306_04920 [Nitrosomonadales bacterium]|nr:hypothetical protein [Nitrosomonadales bacterium]